MAGRTSMILDVAFAWRHLNEPGLRWGSIDDGLQLAHLAEVGNFELCANSLNCTLIRYATLLQPMQTRTLRHRLVPKTSAGTRCSVCNACRYAPAELGVDVWAAADVMP